MFETSSSTDSKEIKISKKAQAELDARNKRKKELENSINEMKKAIFKEQKIQQFMLDDFYFDSIKGFKIKEPISCPYTDIPKLKQICKKLRSQDSEFERQPSDYKELR